MCDVEWLKRQAHGSLMAKRKRRAVVGEVLEFLLVSDEFCAAECRWRERLVHAAEERTAHRWGTPPRLQRHRGHPPVHLS